MAKGKKTSNLKKKTSPKKPSVSSKRLSLRFKIFALILAILFILLGMGVTFAYQYIFVDFPSPEKLKTVEVPLTTKIFDRNGTPLFDIYVDQDRTFVPLDDIPQIVRQATISIEDKDFYKHKGVDPIGGIARAIRENVSKHQLQGGSTITQQLVKTVLLSSERTFKRKAKEMVLAVLVEFKYNKDQILEMYLNHVPYGGTAWGIEAASERYFGKKVQDLTLAEASYLAGLPAAPTYYSPYGANPQLGKDRQKEVLRRMQEDAYITSEQVQEAALQELIFKPPTTNIKAPHFVLYVKDLLVKKYGEKKVEQGGLRVTTTLDLELSDFAQNVVASEVAQLGRYRVSNGAALVTKPATGEILAMVGSIDYFASNSGNFNVTTALRQPGSAIKPINYAIGLENKIVNAATVFIDQPTCFPSIPTPYCPRNYDGKYHGGVQLRYALANSYNIPAVKMLKLNSVQTMVASASAFGITTFNDPNRFGLALTLGGGEVPMTEMVTAYGVFANAGMRKNLVSVLKIEDSQGNILEEYQDPNLNKIHPSSLLISGNRTVSAETAFLISHILQDHQARLAAFGPNNQLQIKGHPAVSVKTGTTDDLRDNWTFGFTPEVVVGAWVGNNDNSPMNPYLTSGVTGAAPIWNKIMQYYLEKKLEDKKESWPRQPAGLVGLNICSFTGYLAPPDHPCPSRYEYFIKGTEPKRIEPIKQAVFIDTTTGKLAAPGQTENVEVQEKLVVKDAFGMYCIDCPQ